MSYCEHCGTALGDQDVFCSECGARIESSVFPETPYETPYGASWETPWETVAQTEPVHEKKRTDLKYRVIIALSIVLIVAAVTVTALVLLGVIRLPQNSSDVAETPLTAPVSEPSEPSSPIEEDPIGQAQPGPSKPDADADSKAPSNDQSDSDYIFADSASRYLSRSEIMPLSQWEMLIARNEIYARHGRGFTTPELANYFRAQSWYHERYSATEFDAMGSVLNDYEEKNALLILEIERELGYM